MKKIYALLSLVIVAFIINFTIWFWQTKIITDNLIELQRQLSQAGIDLSYEEIKFSTFRSWQVNGYIENLKIGFGKQPRTDIEIPNLKFFSKPFDKAVDFTTNDNVSISFTTPISYKSYQINYTEGSYPIITLDLDVSFSAFLDVLRDPHRKPMYTFIRHLQLSSPEFNLTDTKNHSIYLMGKKIFLDLYSDKDNNSRNFIIDLAMNNIIYNSNYIVENDIEKADKSLAVQLGNIDVLFQAHYKEQPSKKQLEFLQQQERQDMKVVFDSYYVDVKEIHFNTDLFGFSLKGYIDKQPEYIIPAGDLKFTLKNYNNFVNHYVDSINLGIDKFTLQYFILPIQKIDEAKKEKFRKALKPFNKEGDNLVLEISRQGGDEIKISGRSLLDIFTELQTLLYEEVPIKAVPNTSVQNNK